MAYIVRSAGPQAQAWIATLAVVSCLSGLGAEQASSIRSDEHVTFFPTFAAEGPGSSWTAQIHGWIYELEDGGAREQLAHLLGDLIRQRFGLSQQTIQGDSHDALVRFERRAAPFLVDSERNKRVAVTVAGTSGIMGASKQSGHFAGTLTLPATAGRAGEWVEVRAALRRGDPRVFAGKVLLIPRTGITVISDIDDTIKHSEVRDRIQLGLNTFVRDFRAIPGMAGLYQQWARGSQVVYHYVSGSPFQLYSHLAEFTQRDGFPDGSYHLRTFRLKDASIVEFFGDPKTFKLNTIRPIIRQFGERRFILVGDSGEHDPEVYATLASEFSNVDAIFIRDVTNETLESPRHARLFAGVPTRVQRRVFRQVSELDDFTPR